MYAPEENAEDSYDTIPVQITQYLAHSRFGSACLARDPQLDEPGTPLRRPCKLLEGTTAFR